MWCLLYSCVLLAISNPLWVQALPTNISSEVNITESVPKCPENEFFNDEGKACELTCAMPLPSSICNETRVPACECIRGYVRTETGECINLVQCLDNASFILDGALPESISNRVIIDEFLSAENETESMSEPENNFFSSQEGEEDDDSNEESKLFTGSIPEFGNSPMGFNEVLELYDLMVKPKNNEQQPDYSDIVEFLRLIVRRKIEEMEAYPNSIQYRKNNYY